MFHFNGFYPYAFMVTKYFFSSVYNLPLIPFCVFIFHLKYCHLHLQKFYVYLFFISFIFFHLAYSIVSLASWMSSVQLHNYFNVFVYYFCHLCHLGSISPLSSPLSSLLWHSALWTLTIFIFPNLPLRLNSKVCPAPLGPPTLCITLET